VRIHIIRVHPPIEDITWAVAAPLNIEIYVILIIITVNSIKVNYGWLCTLCAYRLHAFFSQSSAKRFLCIPNSDISAAILFSLLEHDELERTFTFGRAGDRASSDVDGHGHPKHRLRPHTNQPFGMINSVPLVTGRSLRIFMICGLRRLSP